ncbi:MAG: RsmB/NOP family class I SAM-dependent RNA methyltransferase [Flavobacteriaceae bacterium]|nr:RsmB/NOP family class I SAM-dependent RNA methyltransferase [Flavobacteriaceae bacterium]
MKDGGRLAAAIEVLTDIETRHRPVQQALRDWGTNHRFAGSGDRGVIGNMVFDALRYKTSLGAMLGDASPRLIVLGVYALKWEKGVEGLESVLLNDTHAPEALSEAEKAVLAAPTGDLKPFEQADVPEWLWAGFERAFGENAVAEGQALAARAPIDLRTNTVKSDREKLLKRLRHVNAEITKITPTALRIYPAPGASRMPHVQAEEGYQKGWFELQDEASQIAAFLSGAKPGEQVLDFCAGGGGKTLALAGMMGNKGQIFASDSDNLRLAPIHERLKRSGVHNVQVRNPASSSLEDLEGKLDLVFVDAPCTGTGVWRRRPDSKWRLTEKALADRIEEQKTVLASAATYVKPGGRLVYVTCSVLPEENEDQIAAFLETNAAFSSVSAVEKWKSVFPEAAAPTYANERGDIMLSPASTNTDGFFVALMERKA